MNRIGKMSFPDQPAFLIPPECMVFKVKCNLQELRPPNAQYAVKIVAVILPIVCDKRDLRTNFFVTQI
jgi:hypothetical protein